MRCVIYLRVSTKEQAENGLGEEGFSIPAQREACARHVRDQGWDLVDEYADRGESARSADRRQLQAMLARIAEDGDVDAVVVHKIDRLARNLEDHVAIRALFRRRSVTLVSVTENLEESASGRLGRRHPRADGRVLLGQPRQRDQEGHGPEGQDGRLAPLGTAWLHQRPRDDRGPPGRLHRL